MYTKPHHHHYHLIRTIVFRRARTPKYAQKNAGVCLLLLHLVATASDASSSLRNGAASARAAVHDAEPGMGGAGVPDHHRGLSRAR